MDEVRTGTYRQLFHPEQLISGKEDAAPWLVLSADEASTSIGGQKFIRKFNPNINTLSPQLHERTF